jgi:hypothetical protein
MRRGKFRFRRRAAAPGALASPVREPFVPFIELYAACMEADFRPGLPPAGRAEFLRRAVLAAARAVCDGCSRRGLTLYTLVRGPSGLAVGKCPMCDAGKRLATEGRPS